MAPLAPASEDRYAVALTTTDGVTYDISCRADLSVVAGAAAAGIVLPSLCCTGACGACLATVTDGDYRHAEHDPDAMGPMAGEGAALLCCTYPKGDLQISLPYDDSRIGDDLPPVRTATITALDSLSADVVRLRLTYEPDDVHGSAAEFDPGQFVQLQIPGTTIQRAYSLGNVGNWDGELEFFIRTLSDGAFSSYLRDRAAVGDTLMVRGPQGAFGIQEHGLRRRWFVAGGTGLAPLLSMLRRMAEWGDPQPARLYLGCTTDDDVFGAQEIAELDAALPDFEATTCVWRPSGDVEQRVDPDREAGGSRVRVVAGTPSEVLARDLPTVPHPPDVYVCGPPAMVRAVELVLAEAGLQPSFVHTERFTEN